MHGFLSQWLDVIQVGSFDLKWNLWTSRDGTVEGMKALSLEWQNLQIETIVGCSCFMTLVLRMNTLQT